MDGDQAVEAGGVVELCAHDLVSGAFDSVLIEDGLKNVLHGLGELGFVHLGGGGVGGDVRAVAVAAAGHADVHEGSGELVGDEQVRGVDGCALGAVRRRGVGEFDGFADVGAREGDGLQVVVLDGERAVIPAADDCPAVAVLDEAASADAEAAVVEAGDDVVAEADMSAVVKDDSVWLNLAGGNSVESGAEIEAATVALSAAMRRLVRPADVSACQAR